MNHCPIYGIPTDACNHCARAAKRAAEDAIVQNSFAEARRHVEAAVEALMQARP